MTYIFNKYRMKAKLHIKIRRNSKYIIAYIIIKKIFNILKKIFFKFKKDRE